MRGYRRSRGFTIAELLVLLLLVAILLALTLPVMARGRRNSQVDVSLNNLVALGVAHITYAMDWNGRQFTVVVDDLSYYGVNEQSAYDNYAAQHDEDHPPLMLGRSEDTLYGYYMSWPGNRGLCQPMVWPGGPSHLVGFGAFRVPNCKQFHDYVGGRFYEPTYYAPADWVPYGLVEAEFSEPWEFDPIGGVSDCYWSSYCFSPAAMFAPEVMRSELFGGWLDPWQVLDGFESPGLWQAMYPSLKTQMIEHHWNQNAPADPCNPYFSEGTYDGCEPYYFNHGLASEPATLFYDLSARLLPNTEAIAADMTVMQQTGCGLWSRDTPFGVNGYFGEAGYDVFSLGHHILTTDGILGRDTIDMGVVVPNDLPEQIRPLRTNAQQPANPRGLLMEAD